MRKIYYLKTCSTCQRILKMLPHLDSFVLQDIKSEPITVTQLDEMQEKAGSYAALFSKKAQLYKTLDLNNKNLTESDYKNYILEHYTFLSRPVFVIEDAIFIGNSAKTINDVLAVLNK